MAGIGFKDRRIAEVLKEKALAGIPPFLPKEVSNDLANYKTACQLYLGVADGTIPASSYSGATFTLGEGYVHLLQRYQDDSEYASTIYPENTPSGDYLETPRNIYETAESEDNDTYLYNCERVRVWNPTLNPINPENIEGCLKCPFYCGLSLLLLGKFVNGDIYIIAEIPMDSATTTTSTTTTTHYESGCTGRNKFVWDHTLRQWDLVDSACATTTTTSSGSSTTSTSTTTSSVCVCPDSSSSSSTTTTSSGGLGIELQDGEFLGTQDGDTVDLQETTTTSTTTTTTTTPHCQPNYPTFCGNQDGQCTYTYCSLEINTPPVCPGTSTTTTSTTSSSCDCATTTTLSSCSAGCTWAYLPGFGFELLSNGCGPGCPCEQPAEILPGCESYETPCVSPPVYEPCIHMCEGRCLWFWPKDGTDWLYVHQAQSCHNTCTGTSTIEYPCACTEPSEPGTDCEFQYTPCYKPSSSSTTSTTTGACDYCYSSTSTSTTTTWNGCDKDCKFYVNGLGEWAKYYDPCYPTCPCPFPNFAVTDTCETTATRCGDGTTTTTSTSTTSTTTANPSGYYCGLYLENFYTCFYHNAGSGLPFPPGGYTDVSGPHETAEDCFDACTPGTTTSTSTTTTTTDPDDYYCVVPIANPPEDCSDPYWQECQPGSAIWSFYHVCSGPYGHDISTCQSSCGTTTTTSAP